jgi:WD40 repeat protein/tRNA A-37 threonylcarbamoyl transferase component Bud32
MRDDFPTRDFALPLAARERIDQVCLAFEAAWQSGQRPCLENCLDPAHGPERRALLCELMLLELDYRAQAGETPDAQAYLTRFSEEGELVREVFRRAMAADIAAPPGAGPPRVLGDYEILGEIARGGMGVVYKARQLSLNRPVALKMILAGQLATPAEVERFHREATAAASLCHPNIVAIHEVGKHEGQHYFSMEFVDGKSLRELVRERSLPPVRAARYARILAEAIHYAHGQGILHRDLKPSNVLIDCFDQPQITDFGLAKRAQGDPELTASGQVLGSPSYMPPEQAAADRGDVGPASDVYALGAMLYELLTGRPPFRAATVAETVLQVLHTEPVAPRWLNREVPLDLETICLKCLEKAPSKRYPTAAALADDLGRFLRGEPIQARPVGLLQRCARWCRRNPVIAALAALLAAALLALAIGSSVAAVWLRGERDVAIEHKQRAEQAERDATDRLWNAYLAQAQAARWSKRPGQRFKSLEALTAAAAIHPAPELRDEALACLGLADLRCARSWPVPRNAAVQFDARAERYALLGEDGTLRIRTLADNQEVADLPGPGGRVVDCLFSPDGAALAAQYETAGRAEHHVWDLAQRKVRWKCPAVAGNAGKAFSRNGRLLAVTQPGGKIGVYEVANGELVHSLDAERLPDRLSFHPGARKLALVHYRHPDVHIYDLDAKKVVRVLSGPGGVFMAAWHAQGNLLAAACGDFHIRLWNAETGGEQAVLRGHVAEVTGVIFNGRGDLLVSRSWDGTARLWDPVTGTELVQIGGEFGHFVFGADDRHLALRSNERVELWEVAARAYRTFHEPVQGGKGPWGVDFHPGGTVMASASDDGVRVWDLDAGREVAFVPVGISSTVLFHPVGGHLLLGSVSGFQLCPLVLGPQAKVLQIGAPVVIHARPDTITPRASMSRDGRFVAAVIGPGSFAVYDLKPSPRKIAAGEHAQVASVVLSPDGQWAATSTWGGRGIKLWEARRGKLARDILPEEAGGNVQFSPDGRWLLVATERDYQFWEVGPWRLARDISRNGSQVPGLMAFSPDCRVLAVNASRAAIHLIEPETGRRLATLEPPDFTNTAAMAFSRDGAQLAISGSNRIQVWDLLAVRRQWAAMGLDGGL